ncbi:hypothetical protein ANN_01913 [Periplaneta americana]|uniref:Uncharacterized protein n=1 Tax=Periplaneta americana TaxID=6978 RepID=A0ABQ8TW03_PERAM|nr:hypothetical protein ANN_01913 [Periplaneta americana]
MPGLNPKSLSSAYEEKAYEESTARMMDVTFLSKMNQDYDQTIFSDSENDLQLAVYKLNEIAKKFNMTISERKSEVMAFNGKDHMRCKISINDNIIEQKNELEQATGNKHKRKTPNRPKIRGRRSPVRKNTRRTTVNAPTTLYTKQNRRSINEHDKNTADDKQTRNPHLN